MTKGPRESLLKILDNKTIHVNNEFISCEHGVISLEHELIKNVVVSHHTHDTLCSQEKVTHGVF